MSVNCCKPHFQKISSSSSPSGSVSCCLRPSKNLEALSRAVAYNRKIHVQAVLTENIRKQICTTFKKTVIMHIHGLIQRIHVG